MKGQWLRLEHKAGQSSKWKGVSSKIRVWPCGYPNCERVLNDVDNNILKIYCKFHKELRIKEKNHDCYLKRRGPYKDTKIKLILRLLRTNKKASAYELMAFSYALDKNSIKTFVSILRRKGHYIRNKNGYYYYLGRKIER